MDYNSPRDKKEACDSNKSVITSLSVPSKLDKSDRKSLDLLLQSSIFNSGKNYKQASISTYLRPPDKKISDMNLRSYPKKSEVDNPIKVKEKKRRRCKPHKKGVNNNSPKLSNMAWLSKVKTSDNSNDPKAAGEATNSDEPCKKMKKSTSSSFTKYGVHMQSFEDIVKEMRDCKKYKKCLENLTVVDTVLNLPEVTDDEPESNENTLDCKYMTRKAIKSAFLLHLEYLQEIHSGQRYSERHELFKRCKTYSNIELNYNTSMIVFTGEQKQILANLLYKRFGKSSLDNHYYFKVLLPEICLKIFMEEHNMSYTEASDYLKGRPVEA